MSLRHKPRHQPELDALCNGLTRAFQTSTVVSSDHPAAAVIRACNLERLARELQGQGNWERGKYTRTSIFKRDGFEVMYLCWSPGASSPVHAHSDASSKVCSNCWLSVLEGRLTETLYAPADVELDRLRVTSLGDEHELGTGETGYINDCQGVHKVANHTCYPATSLHVYAPGWANCDLFEEPTDAGGAPIDCDSWGDF